MQRLNEIIADRLKKEPSLLREILNNHSKKVEIIIPNIFQYTFCDGSILEIEETNKSFNIIIIQE